MIEHVTGAGVCRIQEVRVGRLCSPPSQINLQGVRPPQASSRLVLISKDAVSGWQGRASVVPRAEVSLAAGRWEPPSEV